MLPTTPEEMTTILFNTMLSRIYLDISTAARRGRLTEHDISTIERRLLASMREGPDFSQEFTTFEVEPAIAKAVDMMQQFFAATRSARVNDIQQK